MSGSDSLALCLSYKERHCRASYGAAFIMSFITKRMRVFWAAGAAGMLLATVLPASAQQGPNNDGFQRRNGQMQVVRNGQARPMTRDARLPTGASVTKDGFVVAPNGQRTELREGQGCDLRGRPVAVVATATGALALGSPATSAVRPAADTDTDALPARAVLAELFGEREGDEDGRYFKIRKGKKHHGKGKGHGRWKFDD